MLFDAVVVLVHLSMLQHRSPPVGLEYVGNSCAPRFCLLAGRYARPSSVRMGLRSHVNGRCAADKGKGSGFWQGSQ